MENNDKKESKTVVEVNGLGILIFIGACLVCKRVGYRRGYSNGAKSGFMHGYNQAVKEFINSK